LFFCFFYSSLPVAAGEPVVRDVRVSQNSDGTYRFDVTIEHADTGWDHYADAFEVVASDGRVLGTRVLVHPHVNEQPFTRSLSPVRIPSRDTRVEVRARDKVHGLGTPYRGVQLPGR